MTKFDVVVARCPRYEIEVDDTEAAVKKKDAYYGNKLRDDYDDQRVDFYPKFESEGGIDESEDEVDEDAIGAIMTQLCQVNDEAVDMHGGGNFMAAFALFFAKVARFDDELIEEISEVSRRMSACIRRDSRRKH